MKSGHGATSLAVDHRGRNLLVTTAMLMFYREKEGFIVRDISRCRVGWDQDLGIG